MWKRVIDWLIEDILIPWMLWVLMWVAFVAVFVVLPFTLYHYVLSLWRGS